MSAKVTLPDGTVGVISDGVWSAEDEGTAYMLNRMTVEYEPLLPTSFPDMDYARALLIGEIFEAKVDNIVSAIAPDEPGRVD